MKNRTFSLLLVILFLLVGCKSKKDVSLSPKDKGSDKEMYEKAKKYLRKDADKSRLLFKEVMQLYPSSIYAKKAKIGIADSYFKQKDAASLIIAAAEYQEYVNLYPNSPDAVYSKYQIGMCYFRQMKKPERDQTNTYEAIKAFENLLNQYPGTPEAETAKKNITKARHYLATHFYKIGYYNYKYKAYLGAIARFKQVINDYPEFKKNDRLFYFTGKCYYKIGKFDSALSFFQKIINSYPTSKIVKPAIKMIRKIEKITSKESEKK